MRRLTRQMGKESYFMEKTKSFTDIYSKVVTSHSNDVYDPTFVHRELEGAAVDEEAAKPATAVQDCASTIGRMNRAKQQKSSTGPLFMLHPSICLDRVVFFFVTRLFGCSSGGSVGRLVIVRSPVRIPNQLSCLSTCP